MSWDSSSSLCTTAYGPRRNAHMACIAAVRLRTRTGSATGSAFSAAAEGPPPCHTRPTWLAAACPRAGRRPQPTGAWRAWHVQSSLGQDTRTIGAVGHTPAYENAQHITTCNLQATQAHTRGAEATPQLEVIARSVLLGRIRKSQLYAVAMFAKERCACPVQCVHESSDS